MTRCRPRIPMVLTAAILLPAALPAQQRDSALLDQAARELEPPSRTISDASRPAPTVPALGEDQTTSASAGSADEERQARAEVILSQARLELVLARKALRGGRTDEAAQRARWVLESLKRLPDGVDASEQELLAEGILARVRGPAAETRPGHDAPGPPEAPSLPADRDDWDSRIARQVERLAELGRLRDLYNADEARRIHEVDELRIAPEGEIGFPRDWRQITARRTRYRDGVLARSPAVERAGQEWYAAIYDIRDLIYEVPDYQPSEIFLPGEAQRVALDRAALRQRSQIFGGYAEDLALGIPLLRFFGGVDNLEFRKPKFSPQRQREIVEMIRALLDSTGTEPKIETVGP